MDHADHVRLLQGGVTRGGTWADLGAGTGAFTLALADLVGPGGNVIAVDRDRGALHDLERALRPGGATVRTLAADFTIAFALSVARNAGNSAVRSSSPSSSAMFSFVTPAALSSAT